MFKAPKIGTNQAKENTLVETPNLDHAKGIFKPREKLLFQWLEDFYSREFSGTIPVAEFEAQFRVLLHEHFPDSNTTILESMLLHRYLVAHAGLVKYLLSIRALSYSEHASLIFKEGNYLSEKIQNLAFLDKNLALIGRYLDEFEFCPWLHALDQKIKDAAQSIQF